jgi:hypothetical protein
MRKVAAVVMVVALVVLFGQAARAQGADTPANEPKPGGVVVDAVSSTATVDAIDAATRVVTLKFPDGSSKTLKAGPEVRNFDQVRVGDQVKTTYLESVALFVRKSNEKPFPGQVETVQLAPKGAKPGAIVTKTTEITATAEAIDYGKRTVTLKGSRGNLVTYAVDESVENFNNVKVGDELVLRVTEAMAIIVEKAN